jgi:hypothetical protein
MTDRNTYRMCENSFLLEEALNNPNAELAIVLAERLEEVIIDFDVKVEGYTDKIEDLERDIRHLVEEAYIAEGA